MKVATSWREPGESIYSRLDPCDGQWAVGEDALSRLLFWTILPREILRQAKGDLTQWRFTFLLKGRNPSSLEKGEKEKEKKGNNCVPGTCLNFKLAGDTQTILCAVELH